MQRVRDSVDRRAKEAVERAHGALEEARSRDDFRDTTENTLKSRDSKERVN